MQKATYVVTLLLRNFVFWPVEGGTVVFRGNRKVLVAGKELLWNGPTSLEHLLINLSFAPFTLNLSNATAGRVDLWIKTSSLKHSLKNESQIPLEADLTQLFRTHAARLIVCHPNDESFVNEDMPSCIGKTSMIPRFKLTDDMFFDTFVEGFLQGSAPVDLPSLPLSLVFCPTNFAWHTGLLTTSFLETVEKLPQQKCASLSCRLKCVLVIDPTAPKCDFRALTLEILQEMPFLRMTMLDFQLWNSSHVSHYDGTTQSLIAFRKSFGLAQTHPRFTVHPSHLHWRACVWQMGSIFQGRIPRGDWTFIVDCSAVSWSSALPANPMQLQSVAQQLRGEFIPEQWDTVSKNSWRLPLTKKRLMVRLMFYDISSHERNVFSNRTGVDGMMATFGLMRKDEEWSAEAALLKLLKKDGVLASDHLNTCLSGFALEHAQELLNPANARSQCVVCATNFCNTFLDACGHLFCDVCVRAHLDAGGDSCPVCRRKIEEDAWTQVRRTTTRKQDVVQFAKQEQVSYLTRNLKGNICLVVPNGDCALQVAKWSSRSDVVVESAVSPGPPCKRTYDHIICCTTLLPDSRSLELMHSLMQGNSTDVTTLHVLIARCNSGFEESHGWVRDFCKCYSNMIEMSSYS